MRLRPKPTGPHRSTRGLTLIETVLAMLILGGAFVAVLSTVTSSRAAHATAAQRQLGMVLAEDLMAEVLAHDTYKEGITLGPDSGENTGNRSQFDDIDDYHGWTSTPPTDRYGNVVAGAEGYTRSVAVGWRGALDPSVVSLIESGVKIITVTVRSGDRVVAELTAYRTDHYQSPEGSY